MIDVAKRLRLAELLSEAAELEHGLMCQYLFAAFSLKRQPEEGVTWPQLEQMRRWEASIMLVARQEMEHLGLVNNILTAIGEAPYFNRPNFPLGARHYPIHIPFKLERLTLEAVRRFVEFEMPRTLDDAERTSWSRSASRRAGSRRSASSTTRSSRCSPSSTRRSCGSARRVRSS